MPPAVTKVDARQRQSARPYAAQGLQYGAEDPVGRKRSIPGNRNKIICQIANPSRRPEVLRQGRQRLPQSVEQCHPAIQTRQWVIPTGLKYPRQCILAEPCQDTAVRTRSPLLSNTE